MNKHNIIHQLGLHVFIAFLFCTSFVNFYRWTMTSTSYHLRLGQMGVGVTLFLLSISALIWYMRKTIRLILPFIKESQTELTPALQQCISSLDLEAPLKFITFNEPVAFCYGLWKPYICVSTKLVELLSEAELKAVLLHEDYHRQNRDPLRILLAKIVSVTFFFLPIIREWATIYQICLELNADEYAIQKIGKKALSSAIYRLCTYESAPSQLSHVAVAGLSANQARISALLDNQPLYLMPSLKSSIISSSILWFICFLFMMQ